MVRDLPNSCFGRGVGRAAGKKNAIVSRADGRGRQELHHVSV